MGIEKKRRGRGSLKRHHDRPCPKQLRGGPSPHLLSFPFSSLCNRILPSLPPSSFTQTGIRDDGRQQQDQLPPARLLPQPHRRPRQGPLPAAQREQASSSGRSCDGAQARGRRGCGGRSDRPEEDHDRSGHQPGIQNGDALGALPRGAEQRLRRPRQRRQAILQER